MRLSNERQSNSVSFLQVTVRIFRRERISSQRKGVPPFQEPQTSRNDAVPATSTNCGHARSSSAPGAHQAAAQRDGFVPKHLITTAN
jgi:hypothetical protein